MAGMSVYSGGAWRTVTQAYVYFTGAWRTIKAGWVYDGSTWRQFLLGLTASPVGGTIDRGRELTCYACVNFKTDGIEYWSPALGGPTENMDMGLWVDSGVYTDYYVECAINSGSLNYNPASGGRVQCTTDMRFGVVDTTRDAGIDPTANFTITFYTEAGTGGTPVGSATYTVTAARESAV